MKCFVIFICLYTLSYAAPLSSYTFTTSVQSNACPQYPGWAESCATEASGGGIFAISFSGFDQLVPPGLPDPQFRLDIPVSQSVSGKLGYAGGDSTVNGSHFFSGTHGNTGFNLEYYIPISSMSNFLFPISIVESASAESFDMRFMGGMYYPTYATSSVSVDFAPLKLYAFPGTDVTSQVTWNVTQGAAIPEPSAALLVAAVCLAMAVLRRTAV